ncbi:MAG: hypothetical protein ABI024_01520, partial [Vicinamibacterales bacterium]
MSPSERDARIEQLLLAGLDEYFLNHYEPAINLWTRVLFLDRHHDRARAYIDRARNAQAELQRESEAILHQGIAAFQAGDVVNARRLIADALDRGAPRDDAQGMLDRIERLGAGQTAPMPRRSLSIAVPSDETRASVAVPHPRRRNLGAALLLVAAALGVIAVALWGFTLPDPSSLPLLGAGSPNEARAIVPASPSPLPVAGANETYLSRARAQAATGRLRDALHEIDRIPIGDPLRTDADRLRSDIQRQFLDIAASEQSTARPSSVPPALRPP